MAAWTRSMRKAQPLLAEFLKEVRDDFDARNKAYAKIEPDKIKTSFAITLLAPEEAAKVVQAGWENFQDTYQSETITLVSRPGLDSDHTHALLYAGSSCGSLCGGGILIFLTKENGKWPMEGIKQSEHLDVLRLLRYRHWRNIASLTTPALSSSFFHFFSTILHALRETSEKSAISC